ncbi:MAG: LysR family transcriptional regulator [Bacteroidota bacterium]
MNLDDLRLFVEVAQRGSFAAVARDRDLDPSSVSRAVARLEEALGLRLLQRTTRRQALTEAGAVYLTQVEPLMEDLALAHAQAVDAAAQPAGTLRVASPVSFALLNIVPILPAFAERYPKLAVDLVLTDGTPDLVAERLDVALRLGPLADSNLVAQRLAPMVARACAAPAYLARHGTPRTPADLIHHAGLHLAMPGFAERWLFRDADGHRLAVTVPMRLRTSNAVALKQCALAGMGVILQGRWIVGRELRDGRLVDLFPSYEATAATFEAPSVWLLYPTRKYVPLKVQAFVEFVRAAFAAGPPWDAP